MRFLLLSALLVASAIAASGQSTGSADWIRPAAIESPAAAGSAQPQLTSSSRGVVLSWIESDGPRATLKFATRTPAGWSTPRVAASGTDWFVNWADVPSVLRLADGTLAAHWLQKSGADTYAYDVRLSYSTDDGRTWAPSFTPHHDGTRTEHGFASLFQMPGARGGLGVVWLDGRQMKPGHGEGHDAGDMSLRFASYGRDWKQTADTPLDLKVCECCPTAVAVTSSGPVIAYRDRAAAEVRDIYITRLAGTKWSEPAAVSKDNWEFPACPVNGPSLSARGREVALAYFQAKDGAPKSFVVFSKDGGATFGRPIRLDVTGTLGRVDVEMLDDGSAAAAYIELRENQAEFRVRRVQADGSMSAPVTIANLANNRSSGYPRMARAGDDLVFAWVDRAAGSSVKTATARIYRAPR